MKATCMSPLNILVCMRHYPKLSFLQRAHAACRAERANFPRTSLTTECRVADGPSMGSRELYALMRIKQVLSTR